MSATEKDKTPLLGVSQPISLAHPDSKDIAQTTLLIETLKKFGSYEPKEETEQRMEVLRNLNRLVKEWVKNVTAMKVRFLLKYLNFKSMI